MVFSIIYVMYYLFHNVYIFFSNILIQTEALLHKSKKGTIESTEIFLLYEQKTNGKSQHIEQDEIGGGKGVPDM